MFLLAICFWNAIDIPQVDAGKIQVWLHTKKWHTFLCWQDVCRATIDQTYDSQTKDLNNLQCRVVIWFVALFWFTLGSSLMRNMDGWMWLLFWDRFVTKVHWSKRLCQDENPQAQFTLDARHKHMFTPEFNSMLRTEPALCVNWYPDRNCQQGWKHFHTRKRCLLRVEMNAILHNVPACQWKSSHIWMQHVHACVPNWCESIQHTTCWCENALRNARQNNAVCTDPFRFQLWPLGAWWDVTRERDHRFGHKGQVLRCHHALLGGGWHVHVGVRGFDFVPYLVDGW